jgi:hypothetical protein
LTSQAWAVEPGAAGAGVDVGGRVGLRRGIVAVGAGTAAGAPDGARVTTGAGGGSTARTAGDAEASAEGRVETGRGVDARDTTADGDLAVRAGTCGETSDHPHPRTPAPTPPTMVVVNKRRAHVTAI